MDVLNNKKEGQQADFIGYIPRVWWNKGNKTHSPSVLIQCGDCKEKVRIYYGHDDDFYEINGVLADKKWWKLLFKKIGLLDEFDKLT